MTGKHIVIEMTNGSGKTTAIKAAIKEAQSRGRNPVFIKTPSSKNEAACRDTKNPDKIALAKVNAVDKAEASVIAYILTHEGFDVIQDRGTISALMYNGLDGIPFETTVDYIIEATDQIINNPQHLKELAETAAQIQLEQGYLPECRYLHNISGLQSEIEDEFILGITTKRLLIPDLVISPITSPTLIENNLRVRSQKGEELDGYELRHKEELQIFLKSFWSYSEITGGKTIIINTLSGRPSHEYAEQPGDEFFEEVAKNTAKMIVDKIEELPSRHEEFYSYEA